MSSIIKSFSLFSVCLTAGTANLLLFIINLLLLLLRSSLISSSSSDASELRSEFEGEGDCGERFSCSCMIVRNS